MGHRATPPRPAPQGRSAQPHRLPSWRTTSSPLRGPCKSHFRLRMSAQRAQDVFFLPPFLQLHDRAFRDPLQQPLGVAVGHCCPMNAEVRAANFRQHVGDSPVQAEVVIREQGAPHTVQHLPREPGARSAQGSELVLRQETEARLVEDVHEEVGDAAIRDARCQGPDGSTKLRKRERLVEIDDGARRLTPPRASPRTLPASFPRGRNLEASPQKPCTRTTRGFACTSEVPFVADAAGWCKIRQAHQGSRFGAHFVPLLASLTRAYSCRRSRGKFAREVGSEWRGFPGDPRGPLRARAPGVIAPGWTNRAFRSRFW